MLFEAQLMLQLSARTQLPTNCPPGTAPVRLMCQCPLHGPPRVMWSDVSKIRGVDSRSLNMTHFYMPYGTILCRVRSTKGSKNGSILVRRVEGVEFNEHSLQHLHGVQGQVGEPMEPVQPRGGLKTTLYR